MNRSIKSGRWMIIAALLLLLALVGAWSLTAREAGVPQPGPQPSPQLGPKVGLLTTLPIYWGEADGLDTMLSEQADPHWARAVLERKFRLLPLDSLAAEDMPDPLARLDYLLLAQPRVLSGAENVALDAWVRGGGRLLVFADPMLTGHSRFHIGDRRRPQDVVLLSPILQRWGLSLSFDEDQAAGQRMVTIGTTPVPVNLPGQLAIVATPPDARADCSLLAEGLAADCRIGSGHVLIIADAALLDLEAADETRMTGLLALATRMFASAD